MLSLVLASGVCNISSHNEALACRATVFYVIFESPRFVYATTAHAMQSVGAAAMTAATINCPYLTGCVSKAIWSISQHFMQLHKPASAAIFSCHCCALGDIPVLYRERTEASDFNAALYEHTQYLRRKKEAQQRRQAYESTADDNELGASSSSQSELSLKPGETITLKLGKVGHALQPVWSSPVLQLSLS